MFLLVKTLGVPWVPFGMGLHEALCNGLLYATRRLLYLWSAETPMRLCQGESLEVRYACVSRLKI